MHLVKYNYWNLTWIEESLLKLLLRVPAALNRLIMSVYQKIISGEAFDPLFL